MGGASKEAVIPPWGLAIAGATGAVIANAIVYPLDVYVPLQTPADSKVSPDTDINISFSQYQNQNPSTREAATGPRCERNG